MFTLPFVSVAFASVIASQSLAPSPDKLLAKIPEELEVADDLLHRSNRGAFVSRSTLVWSAGGSTVAYVGRRGDEWFPVIGAQVGKSYDGVDPPITAGSHVFFHVRHTKTESTEDHWLWIDGKTVGPEDWMGDLGVSADGKHVAFWTWPGAHVGNGPQSPANSQRLAIASEDKNGQWTVRRSDKWAECGLLPPVFSVGGERALSCAVGSKGWVVLELVGKRPKELTDAQQLIDAFAIAETGNALAFVRTDALAGNSAPVPLASEHAELYFKGKRVGPKHVGITQPTVDARGEHVACVVTIEKSRTVAIDGEAKPAGRFDHVLELLFDPNGKRLAFVANRGGKLSPNAPGVVSGGDSLVVVRSVATPATSDERAGFRDVRDLVWDAAGEKLAYCVRDRDGWRVVCGERASEPHSDVGLPRFAADGKSLTFGTRDGRELWWRALAIE